MNIWWLESSSLDFPCSLPYWTLFRFLSHTILFCQSLQSSHCLETERTWVCLWQVITHYICINFFFFYLFPSVIRLSSSWVKIFLFLLFQSFPPSCLDMDRVGRWQYEAHENIVANERNLCKNLCLSTVRSITLWI